MTYYILKNKKPVAVDDVLIWGKMFESIENRIVCKTTLNDVKISTVFLGLDYNFQNEGEPILFETMVFGGELDQEMQRYSTWEDAEKGHATMVERVRDAQES